MRLLIKGGRVVDPASSETGRVADVLCENGRIVAVEAEYSADADRVIDAAGGWVIPGPIDLHAHVGEPGYEARETLASLAAAAVRGGFAQVVVMPDTRPVRDQVFAVEAFLERSRRLPCRLLPAAALTAESRGEEPSEWGELVEAGAVALGDTKPVADSGLLRRALLYLRRWQRPILVDCLDASLSEGAVAWEGVDATRFGLRGMPAEAEAIPLVQALLLARLTGGRLHVQHVSTRQGVEWIRWAKEQGIPVTAEVSWLHLLEDVSVLGDYDTAWKVRPPLGDASNREALRDAVATGIIDAVVSDHTPFAREEKNVEFEMAPFGAAGIECMLPALWSGLVEAGRMSAETLVARLTEGPARILGRPAPRIAVGEPADLTVLKPGEWRFEPTRRASLAANHPYDGRSLSVYVAATIVAGEVRHEQEE